MRRRAFFSILFLCFIAPGAFCAVNVQVTAKAFPSKATLGDEIRLVIQIERPKKFIVDAPSEKINLSPFEVKRVEVSPTQRGENRVQETFTVVLTAFEMGKLKVPAFPILYRTDTGRVERLMTDLVDVEVVSVGKKSTGKEDIRSIKGPVFFDLRFIKDWVCGILAALLTIFLIAKVIRRRNKNKIDPESLLAADDRARLELGRLKKKGYLEERKMKEFYSELSNILRRYFERQYLIVALESTTEELISTLKQKEFNSGAVQKIKEVLEACDLVKFAKYDPPASLASSLEAKVFEILVETKPETTP